MFCDQCGKQMPDDSVYCPNCGAKNSIPESVQEVYSEPETPQPTTVPQPAVQAQPVVQQQPSQQAVQQTQPPIDLTKPISVIGYMGMLFLLAIPIIGLVMTFIWAFGSKVNKNRKHLAIALLIYWVVSIVLAIIFGSTVFIAITDFIDDLG